MATSIGVKNVTRSGKGKHETQRVYEKRLSGGNGYGETELRSVNPRALTFHQGGEEEGANIEKGGSKSKKQKR